MALALAVAGAFASATSGIARVTSPAPQQTPKAGSAQSDMKIRIRIGGRLLTATVARTAAGRDFLSRLPLTLSMSDLSGRGKTATLARALATGGTARHTFSAGDIAYWPGSRRVVAYYRAADVPQSGVTLLARLDSTVRAFSVAGTVRVRMERVRTTQPAAPLPPQIAGTTVRFSSERASVNVTIGQDNPAVRDFLSMLPLTITVEEFTGREKIAYLPRKLRHSGSPGSDPKDGDLIYFVPWGNLGFYYNADGIGYSDATIHLGTYSASRDQLARLEGKVTVRMISR